MEDWKLNKIHIWLRAASMIDADRNVKFFIDKEDKLFFNLINKDNKWRCVLNQEIGVNYSKEDLIILQEKIESLKNGKNTIVEIPKLTQFQIDEIERIKLEYKSGNKLGIDLWEHEKIVYWNPTDFVIRWLNEIGIEVEKTKLIR